MRAVLLLFAALRDPGVAQQQTVSSQDPVYDLALPAGYFPVKSPEGVTVYERTAGREDWAKVRISLTINPKALAQKPAGLGPDDLLPFVRLPEDAQVKQTQAQWGEFTIGALEFRAVANDLRVFGLAVVVPLARHALTITLLAPDPLEAEVRDALRQTLPTILGPTDWRTAAQQRESVTARWVSTAGGVLVVLYAVAWGLFFRGQDMKFHLLRTVWLVVIAALFFIPLTLSGDPGLLNNWAVNTLVPTAYLLLTMRRIKLAIDMG